MSRPLSLLVDQTGAGDARSLGEALERSAGHLGPVQLRLAPGTYHEKVFTDRPDLTLLGLGRHPSEVVLTWDDHALRPLPDGRPMRTFNSATLFVGADRFTAQNLTIANTAGPGALVGQAVAAYVDADLAVFRRCRFLGRQDTLFTGPLPPFPRDAADFGGPRDSGPAPLSPKRPDSPAVGRQLYEDCSLEGDIDFLFGSAEAVFRRCEVRSRNLGQAVNGWVSAASTPERGSLSPDADPFVDDRARRAVETLARAKGQDGSWHGHLFIDCQLTAEPGTARGSVYLGRPWRDFARTMFVGCWLGEHIHPAGWDDWGKSQAQATSLYGELGCTGPGSLGARVDWAVRKETPC